MNRTKIRREEEEAEALELHHIVYGVHGGGERKNHVRIALRVYTCAIV